MAKEYIYAVSRIHANEQKLLTRYDLENLLLCKDFESCMRMLKDKGYGNADNSDSADLMLKAENDKTWELLDELTGDREILNIFRYKADFHNLKLAIKSVFTDTSPQEYIMSGGSVNAEEIIKSVKEKKFDDLPPFLIEPGKEAFKTLLETSSGQLCDIIIDKACVEHVYNTGIKHENETVRLYARLFAVNADVKTAFRCMVFNKSADFMRRALSDDTVLDKDELIKAALSGKDALCDFLLKTEYAHLVPSLKTGVTQFEKACDDYLMNKLKEQKNDHFSIGPLCAYLIAKETEIKAVRLILSAKLNGLDEGIIKERLRELYV